MAYDETTLRNEIVNANDGDTVEITADIYLSAAVHVTRDIIVQSSNGNIFTIFQETPTRHFTCLSSTAGLTLRAITVDGCNTGGGVSITAGGHLTLGSGATVRNCFSHIGGGISLGSDLGTSAVMQSGSAILNCSSELHGGGVFVGPYCTFTLEDGATISKCSTSEYGGGIYIVEGDFIMNGGEISDCRSSGGGGIFVYYPVGSSLSSGIAINGGKVSKCIAAFGGGILFIKTTRVTVMNATITDNYSTSYGGGIGILEGTLANINTALVNGNFAQLSDGVDAQIYVYADQLSYGGTSYTLIDSNSADVQVVLLNGELCRPFFFKAKDDFSGELYVAFCAEPETEIILSDYFLVYYLQNVLLKQELTDKIAITIKTALKGERSYDLVSSDALLTIRAYVAQYVIWNIVLGHYVSDELATARERIREALGDQAADCLDEIVDAIKYYENPILPSFAGTLLNIPTCYLVYDSNDGKWKVTLSDLNDVLGNFVVDSSLLPQGLSVVLDYAQNTMTIICDDKSILKGGDMVIRLLALLEDGGASVFFHPLYQDIVVPDNRYEIVLNAYVRPMIRNGKCKRKCSCYATPCREIVRGRKIWIDNNNAGKTRPETVEILLLRNDEVFRSMVLDSTAESFFEFCCLPKWNKNGQMYDYQVDEAVVPDGYTKTVKGHDVVNTLNP